MEKIDVTMKIVHHIHDILHDFIDQTRGDGGWGDASEYGQILYLKKKL